MEAAGIKGVFSTSISNVYDVYFQEAVDKSTVNLGSQVVGKKDIGFIGTRVVEQYTCIECCDTFLYKSRLIGHQKLIHHRDVSSNEAYKRFSVSYASIKIYYCGECQREHKGSEAFRIHLYRRHQKKAVFEEGNLVAIINYQHRKPTNNNIVCNVCCEKFNTVKDKQDHLENFDHAGYFTCLEPSCSSAYNYYKSLKRHCMNAHNKILKYSNQQYCELFKEFLRSRPKVQDSTIVTNITVDNRTSKRKHSELPVRCDKELKTKKARLNPSEDFALYGYCKSDNSKQISTPAVQDHTNVANTTMDNMASISRYSQSVLSSDISDDNLALNAWEYCLSNINDCNSYTPSTASNSDPRNTAFQTSVISGNDIDNKELSELLQELMKTNNDFNTSAMEYAKTC